jgi:pimeloyl-ACP methyl ester carboxylesterase
MRAFLRACPAKPLPAEDFETALAWNMAVPARVRAHLAAREINGDDVLRTLTVPLLVIQGREDTVVLPAMRPARARHLPDLPGVLV